MIKPELLSANRAFGGWHSRYRHESSVCHCDMTFALYLPPQAETRPVPVLYWLSGLTCTDENFMQKAGALRIAAELGIAIVAPDTSPRGEVVPDDPDAAYDLGLGAGFYINAVRDPWARYYRMYDYVVDELPELIESSFAVTDRRAISGHSMGGHGAMTIGLKNPQRYTSVSAFSPIVNPVQCPWGIKAFSNYLGEERDDWRQYDSCELLSVMNGNRILPFLIDQGDRDDFLGEQLLTQNLERVLVKTGYAMDIRYQPGYDHSYYFIASFIEEHLRFHHQYLLG